MCLEQEKTEHENIGFGNIGYDTLRQIIYMEQFENIPKILETPYVKDPENSKNLMHHISLK
mgnify:CR=1 FL=1